jgi:hypothetical protein
MFLGGYPLINPIGTAIAATGIVPAKIASKPIKWITVKRRLILI